MTDRIRIKQYEQAADDKVSIGGIKWLQKWDVCIQCDSAEEAKALRARLAQPEPEPYPDDFIDALRYHTAISEQPEQEPVAWTVRGLITDFSQDFSAYQTKTYTVPLYTTPPQREWQGLTDEETEQIIDAHWNDPSMFIEAIEAKLKEKNHAT